MKSEQKDIKQTKRQRDIERVAKLASDQLLKSWLVIDEMLPEHLQPIRDGLKHRRPEIKFIHAEAF